jgi:Na+-driven multidrug efflux pump
MGVLSRITDAFKGPEEFDLKSGSIGKPLFFLAMPIVVTNLSQTAYNIADMFWLGQFRELTRRCIMHNLEQAAS